MLQTVNNKILRNFSASARAYDLYSGLHREIADKLFSRIVQETKPSTLLDVGCGTGYLTVRLKENFPQSEIVGLDIAPQMLEVARPKHEGIAWVLADGLHMPFADGSFDILVSNLTYQWAGDLSRAFGEARRVLVPGGVLACTLFGYNTCRELFQSLDEARTNALQFSRLPDEQHIRRALTESGFEYPVIDVELIKIEFDGMHELITWLRSIGSNNLSREGFLGPDTLSRAASIYREKFPYLQGVGASFEIINVYAKK